MDNNPPLKSPFDLKDDNLPPLTRITEGVVQEKIDNYSKELVGESRKVAKRDGTDAVSAKHVEIAHNNITTNSRSGLYQNLNAWGGVFLGTSLSTLVSMILNNSFPVIGVVTVTILGMAGAYLMGITKNKR